ncbi:MAG TPA: outer membrane beta-barrel protein [Kofleriaceae bacterium]|nr:outer membrane beta-barrel protein [Kofleriaceae bacterium]
MKRACLTVMLLAALSGTASANGYLGLGIGTSPAMSETPDRLEADGRSLKALVGTRIGQVSIEGSLGGYGTLLENQVGDYVSYGTAYQAALAAKVSLPLGSGFEVFGKGGLHHSWISADRNEEKDVSGNGLLLGAGFEYRFNAGVAGASLFIDYQYSKQNLTGDTLHFDGNTRVWTLGFTVGI